MRSWEYAGTTTLMAGAFALRFAGPDPPDNWHGGILFDDWVLDRTEIDDFSAHNTVRVASNFLYIGAMGYRFIDASLLPWLVHDNADLAWQLSWIDLEAFALVASVLWASQALVGRTRPYTERRCDSAEFDDSALCIDGNNNARRSFIAGHAAVAVTAAGLTCWHHSRLPLYGGWGDDVACGASATLAGLTAYSRIASEQHYPSDVALAIGLGAFAGWLLPGALHYGFGGVSEAEITGRQPGNAVQLMLIPSVTGEWGIEAVGVF